MRPLVSPAEMARADAQAISAGTPASVLMERAGRALARAVLRVAQRTYGARVTVVCGRGSNGGDGFVAARSLARRGAALRCLVVGDPASIRGAAGEQRNALVAAGVSVEGFDRHRLQGSDVIVDALFGTGFHGRPEGGSAAAIEAVNAARAPIVAADIPSGVDGSTGAVDGPAVRAAATVAMQCEKHGTATGPGAALAGRVEVADIGITPPSTQVFMAERSDVAAALPRRALDAHKRSGGAVALLAGSDGMAGAAVLCARGAVRMGAGYATVGATAAVARSVAGLVPEVLTWRLTDEEILGPDALGAFGPVLERAASVAVGPGLGWGDDQRALVHKALASVDLPVVLDADGLNVLSGDTGPLEERSAPTVVTPHPVEMSRLLATEVAAVQRDRISSARAAARRWGCTVLLKGWRTVVAAPSGRVVIVPTGGPELATAGSGDVLTGAVAALLAAGLDPFTAGWAGAFVHGIAGSVAGERSGASSVVAGEVADALGHALEIVASGGPEEPAGRFSP